MQTKKNKWFNAWTTPISEILDGKTKNVESAITEGMCIKVMPDLHNSFYGPYLNGVIENNGEERVFLICLEKDSDYSYSAGLALKGEYIKPCKKDGTGKLFTKRFADLVEVNARKRLEAIAAESDDSPLLTSPSSKADLVNEVVTTTGANSKSDLVNEVVTTTGANSKADLVNEVVTTTGANSKSDLVNEVIAAPGIDNFADKLEVTSQEVDKKFSKRDLIAYTLVNHFLSRTNLPFFSHDN